MKPRLAAWACALGAACLLPPVHSAARGAHTLGRSGRRAEEELAGVNIREGTLYDLVGIFGDPSFVQGREQMRFCWRISGATLCALNSVDVVGPPRMPFRVTVLSLASVVVWGSKASGIVGRTGAGLALGRPCSSALSLYGAPYRRYPHELYYVFPHSALRVGCGGSQRVVRLQLLSGGGQ